MSFLDKIIGTIKNPKNAMKSIAEQPMIEDATIIVGIYAILNALVRYVQSYKISVVVTILSIAGGLLSAFLIWLIFAGIIHLISMALGGKGKFYPQSMTVVGYSMIPMLFEGVIELALLFIMEPVPITVSTTNPITAEDVYNNPYLFVSSIIGIIMRIWVSILLFFGVQSAHRLTGAKSAIVAGTSLVISVISIIWSIWGRGVS